MKQAITPAYTFTPSGTPGLSTLNLSGIANFNVALLYAVIDLTQNLVIYSAGSSGAPGLGYVNVNGTTLTLDAALPTCQSTDKLLVIYEVGVGVGTDASVNAPAIPNVGANFGTSGPYANYLLQQTIPASPARANIEVQNTSGAQIVLVRDDGTAASGAPPNNASLIPLAAGAGLGAQGGAWNSTTFKGRVQIYAPTTGAFVTVLQD